MLDTMTWFTILLLQVLLATFVESQLNLECPAGYEIKDSYCYKKIYATFPWEKAEDACEREGSRLVWIDDWYENDYVKTLMTTAPEDMYWTGLKKTDNEWKWTGNSEGYNLYYGFWETMQPDTNSGAECVAGMVNGDWMLVPCQKMLPFICKTTAYPPGSFKCSKGPAISSMHKCDGYNDCEDGSDEVQCDFGSYCNWYSSASSGTKQIFYLRGKTCLFTLKANIGERISVTLSSPLTTVEDHADSLKVYTGGLTTSESYLIGTVKGSLNPGQTFISGNHYMILRMTTDQSREGQSITMTWTNVVPEIFNSPRSLTGTSSYTQLSSPFYPSMLPPDLAMAWDITAASPGQVITVMFEEVSLDSGSSLELYDRDMTNAVLSDISSIPDPAMYISYSSTIRIYLTSSPAYQSRASGFRLLYKEGCADNTFNPASSGTIRTPGFLTGAYPRGVTCTWNIIAPQQKRLTVRKLLFNLHGNADFMKVYNSSNSPLHTGSGYTGLIASPLVIQSDFLKIEFLSDKVRSGTGFELKYSVDCELWTPSTGTVITETAGPYPSFESSIVVTCNEGYSFMQEEYNQMTAVPMFCNAGGKWIVSRIPECMITYCPIPPKVSNGWISAGSGGVRVGGNVTYECEDGFVLSNSAPIKCKTDGTWEDPPSCTSTSCNSLPFFANGNTRNLTATLNQYADVLEYYCNEGYETVGPTFAYCQTNGTWSHSPPTCQAITCPLVPVMNAEWATMEGVPFGDTGSLTCSVGFKWNVTNSPGLTVTCLANGTFSNMEGCIDIDECTDGSDNCTQLEDCDNTIGGFKCDCKKGYFRNSTSLLCQDILECSVNNGGCSDTCNEETPGYSCSCPTGYDLYTEVNQNNISISSVETGLREGDDIYINHTCVRTTCDSLSHPSNGQRLTEDAYTFYYEDTVYFACDIGYIMSGSKNITCGANQWSASPPTCNRASCTVPAHGPRMLNTSIAQGGMAYLSDAVTFQCEYGSQVVERTMYCGYLGNDQYGWQGDNYSCPEINCGDPEVVPGSVYTSHTGNSWKDNFTFGCDTGFDDTGVSTTNNSVVICEENGRWGLGNLTCSGALCSDPGTRIDAQQIATSYEVGKEVYWICDRGGFFPDPPTVIKCQITGNSVDWNSTVRPTCKDKESPQFNSCPTGAIYLQKSTTLNYVVPTATDNTGVLKSFSVQPNNMEPGSIINENTTIVYTAEDYAGNTATCEISVIVIEGSAPLLSCPNTSVHYINTSSGYSINPLSDIPGFTLPTLPGVTYAANPPLVTVNFVSLNNLQKVTVTASYRNLLHSSCSFLVATEASGCLINSLQPVENSGKSCAANTYSCYIPCINDFVHYDTGLNTKHYNCTGANIWTPPLSREPCINPMNSLYTITINATFEVQQPASECMNAFKFSAHPSLLQAMQSLSCAETTLSISQIIDSTVTDTNSISSIITITLSPNTLGPFKEICSNSIDAYIKAPTISPLTKVSSPISCSSGTSTVVPVLDKSGVRSARNACPTAGYVLRQKDGDQECVPTLPGTYEAGDMSVSCPDGTYQDMSGQTSCKDCSSGTVPDTSKEKCIETCPRGFISDDGFPPCRPCDVDYYWGNSTHCMPCVSNTSTVERNGMGYDTDCKAECQPGWFSATGYEPCMLCPSNFYQELTAQKGCMECNTGATTANPGSNNSSLCVDAVSTLCTNTTCGGNGVCSVKNHKAFCTCNPGYYGDNCENMNNYCSASPCLQGSCNNLQGIDYNCSCNTGYAGDNCDEDLTISCAVNQCQAGSCKSLRNGYDCLCPVTGGYTQPYCQRVDDLCSGTPCQNGATCVAFGSVRKQCICLPGYTGEDCGTDINECTENPLGCMYNGTCVNEVNGYRCQCRTGFSGSNDNCHNLNNFCDTDRCFNAECYNDYDNYRSVCMCHDGYHLDNNGKCIQTDPCQGVNCNTDNGVCSNGKCLCVQGFTGEYCQHDIIDCTESTCDNGGTCVDRTNGVECTCMSGYTGDRCQTNIDDCVGQCTGEHVIVSDRCTDKVNDYMCNCEAGWKGQNCMENIDECASYPCKHGANCTDGDNTYTCGCKTGWTGQDCSMPVNYCQNSPCQNKGTCYNMNNDFFCSCLGGTTGNTCSTFPPVCPVVLPCTAQGSCTDEDGTAKCNCMSDFYTGSSCQLKTYHCGESPCENDGTCVTNSNMGFTCDCKNSYYGTTCGQYNDPCIPSPCTPGAVCMSDGDEYSCACPGGAVMTDTQCKSSSPIGDMLVDADVDSSGTYLNNPFIFSNADMFSVMLWVLCSNATYSSPMIMALEPRDIGDKGPGWMASPPTEKYLVKMTNEGVMFNNGSHSHMVDFDKNICDKKWHHVSLTYHKNSTTFVKLDSITKANNEMTVSGISASMFQVLLGRLFHGRLSQVMIWNKILTLNDQLRAFETVSNIPSLNNIVQKWMNYVQTKGVTFTTVTAAPNSVCDKGLQGESCVMADKMPPTVVKCPDSMKQLPGPNERIVNIPNLKNSFEFADYMNTYSSVVDGESYLRGRYIIAAYAIDEKQNFAECRFPVYIQYADCPQPIVPGGTLGTCSVDSETKTCSANCPAGSDISGSIPKYFHCTNVGVYKPAEPYQPIILPPCATASNSNTRKVAVELIYDVVISCSLVDVTEFDNALRSSLQSSGICGVSCTISTNLRCMTPSGKVMLVGFTLSGLGATLAVAFDGGAPEAYSPFEAVTYVVFNTNALDFQNDVGGAVLRLSDGSVTIEESVSCSDGYQVIGTQCVQCSVGQYFDSDTRTCKLCAWNTYQDQFGMSTCKPCNGNNITLIQGAPDSSFCVDNCTAGNFYNESTSSCEPCAKDFYQEHYGRNYCNFCPIDKITTGTGSDSPADCNDDCPVGYERIQSNQNCVACPKGTFRIQLAEKCVPCDEGFTTDGVATPDASGCSFRICYNGTFRNASNYCEDCPYGYYQDENLKDECKKCPDSESTMSMGSNDSSQCIFVCGAGEEVTGQRLCTPCNRSYYHTGEHPDIFNSCQQCPTNKTTELTGSTHMDNCSIVICDKGQELNSSGDGCVDCPYNTFQDKYMPDSYQKCTSCGTNKATQNMKSTSFDDCLLYCPTAGTYDIGDGNCETCPRGTYRSVNDHSTTFSPCMNCSSGWTTEGEGNIGEFNCSIEICPKGQELNSSGYCVTCPYDTYQDIDIPTSMDRCKSCLSNEATVNMGSTNKTECKPYCTQAGTEFNDQGICVPCPRGMYRSIDDRTKYFTSCINCTTDRTTEGEGSISNLNCSIDKCQAGQVVDSNGNCASCPKNTYQPIMYPNSAVKCIDCSSNKATLEGGQISVDSCVRVCDAGQQYNSVTDQCEPCAKGTWNNGNETMKFQQCASCPVNYTTVAGGNTDIANCSLLDCAPGSYISGQNCLLCGLGTYQPNRHESSCISCGTDQNTTNVGSSQESQCQIFCSPGFAGVPDPNSPTGDKQCAKCPADTIKVQAGLDNCVSCEVNSANFTANDARTECNVIYCDKGFRYNASATTDKCIPCEQGTYKSSRGRATTCETCDPGFTTSGIAATNNTDCNQLNCVIGKYYDATSDSCQLCVVGTYKATVGNTNCTACETGFTTPITGATSAAQCTIVVCPAGKKRNIVTNTCQDCAYGEYQPNSGQTSCNTCTPTTYSTQFTGTILESDCIPTCGQGYEYNTTSRMCDACGLGTYKALIGNWQNDRTTVINCTACSSTKTTPSVASTSSNDCSLNLCQAGQFQQNGACVPCQKGSYQDIVGQTSCKSCGSGKTTKLFSGSTSAQDCIPDCPLGKQHDHSSSSCCCVDCPKGYYVNKTLSEYCIRCPFGTNNLSPGSLTCPYTDDSQVQTRLVRLSFSLQMRVSNFGCSDSNSLNIYNANLKTRIVSRMQSLSYNLCIPSTCDNIQAMTITLSSSNGCSPVAVNGRRKRATDAVLNLNVAVQPVPDPATSNTNGISRPINDVVNEMLNTNPESITPPGSSLNSGSVTSITPQCNAGQVLNSGTCEACGIGTYENLGTCVNCPLNQYQDLTGQTTCKLCSATSSVRIYTTGTNSTSVSQCVSVCTSNSDYCKNGGTCVVDQTVYCQCGSRYSGTNCEIRSEPDNSTWIYIVAGTIGGIVFLVIVIIIIVVFCRRPRSRKPKVVYEKEETPRTNYGYQSYPDNVGFPYQYPVVQQSMTQALPETYYLPYQQPYQQSRAIHSGRYRGFEVDDENSSGYKWTSFSEH